MVDIPVCYTTCVLCGGFILYLFSPRIIGNLFPPDPQFFSNPECVLPCWQGIRVGETSGTEMADLLSSDLFSYYHTQQIGTQTVYSAQRSTGPTDYGVQAYANNDDVFVVRIQGTNITLGDVINRFGLPDSIHLAVVHNIDSPFAPSIWAILQVYYPEYGLLFQVGDIGASETSAGARVCIEASARVQSVTITEAGSLDVLIRDGFYLGNTDEATVESYRSLLVNWTGFTCVNQPAWQ
ncbi:MAG: hypothetical protein U0694_07410 [Anaerolineae bacterium]